MNALEQPRRPFPPFDAESATQKVRMAEDAWNTRNPETVSLAYSADSRRRNRSEFLTGREAIVNFLRRKWENERDYRLIKEPVSYTHLRAHETVLDLVCRLLLEKKKPKNNKYDHDI